MSVRSAAGFAAGFNAVLQVITRRPIWVALLGLLLILGTAAGLQRIVKDTSVEAFVPPGHPALLANQATTELFGLTDPIAVAVFSEDSVFQERNLALIQQLTDAVAMLPNVRADRVASITSESSIVGDQGAILVDPYFDPDRAVAAAEQRWRAMPPHISTLVSADARGAVIMAELVDPDLAVQTYAAVQTLVASFSEPGVEIQVAGPAAVSGFLSAAIDADARLLQPVVFLIVLTFLYLAFMRATALAGPLVVLLGAAGGALGLMAWHGVPYFAITNALPVILVAISVADAIHILSAYFERRAQQPERDVRQVVVASVAVMARPITLTTLTTMAGFAGIALMSIMPPITYFAWYATLGVFLAWLFSLFVLPAVLVLVQPQPSRLFAPSQGARKPGVSTLLGGLAVRAARSPGGVIMCFAALLMVAGIGAAQLRVDRSQVDNFAVDEPIRLADERIHQSFAGTAFLDVIVEASDGDLLQGRRMQKIADLQAFLEAQPHVSKTVSIADYLGLLHAAISETDTQNLRTLPQGDDAVAQYLMVYEASGDPTDFEEEITPDYSAALIRGVLDSHYFSDSRAVVEALQTYLAEEFNEPGMQGVIAGDVNVAYHWMSDLEVSHFAGVGLSLLLILGMAIVVFASPLIGTIAVLPVCTTVLCIYGVMGFLGIHLEPATSMFAAISVGVGVDFAIHLVDRIRAEHGDGQATPLAVVAAAAPATARACFFNAAALGVGFAVLMISDLPTLQRFGGLVTVAALASFLTALLLVPACYTLLWRWRQRHAAVPSTPAVSGGLLVAMGLLCLPATDVHAADITGLEVAQKVAERAEPAAVTKTIEMQLINKRGSTRQRTAIVYRRNGDAVKDTRITYLAPKPVRELTFLGRDFKNLGKADQRWLYVPAARKVRRIPASDRGDFFLGTDFTYEDVQSDLKFELDDFDFSLLQAESFQGATAYRIAGVTRSAKLSRQLGHDRFEALVETATWLPREIIFFAGNKRIKTIDVLAIKQVDNIWTAQKIEARNHRTGHTTIFSYVDIKHAASLPEHLFASTQLDRGLPGSLR